jgi:anaerobic selenocysteine-containing dehydrogenase
VSMEHPFNTVQIPGGKIPFDVRGILQGDWVTLSTPRHSVELKANLTEIVPPGVANVYHGYVQPEVNRLIDPDYLDPISGYPGFKSLICQIKKLAKGKEDR